MGTLEREAASKRRKTYVQDAVLSVIAVAGILAITAVAPNALRLLGGTGRKGFRFNYQTRSVLTRLVEKGHIRFVIQNGKKRIEITNAGKRAAELAAAKQALSTQKPRRWDERWRVIMFDIPERRKKDRDQLRRTMIDAGFLCFQDSVWIFPYDCEDLVTLLKVDMRLGDAVRYGILEKLENDRAARNHFKLI